MVFSSSDEEDGYGDEGLANFDYWMDELVAAEERKAAIAYDREMEYVVDANAFSIERKFNITWLHHARCHLVGEAAAMFEMKVELLTGLRVKERMALALKELYAIGTCLGKCFLYPEDELLWVIESEACIYQWQQSTHGWHVDYLRENLTDKQLALVPNYRLNYGKYLTYGDVTLQYASSDSDETDIED